MDGSADEGARMRAAVPGLLLGAVLAGNAPAYDAGDPANCNGAEWDKDLALTVSKVTAEPRANFIKSSYDDDLQLKPVRRRPGCVRKNPTS